MVCGSPYLSLHHAVSGQILEGGLYRPVTLLGIPIAFNHSTTSETSLALASTTAFTRSTAVLIENEQWLTLSATQIQSRQAQRRSAGGRKMDLRYQSLVGLKC